MDQVLALIDGKRVLGVPSEIKEVTNALRVYDKLEKYNPLSLDDLKLAHEDLMEGLVDNSGELRSSGVGIQRDEEIIHVDPIVTNVPYLLTLSSVFHS